MQVLLKSRLLCAEQNIQFNGNSQAYVNLHDPEPRNVFLQSAFEPVTCSFGANSGVNWCPHRAWKNPVLWKRKDFDMLADYLAKFAMYDDQSGTQTFE